ncbi:hypothetical protein Ccel_0331 [Ruminiclostridium cellulolyticum H10]|uniref:Uncharacterized protein n=1 Tax=Ruminiclostridium cellulolyticum (strain ATCC 35319 / DSM 5812 / JCM 6584 / H10) TaxID=394503 RepID=B8I5Q1_RUMCH|nr:hypothetical protein Ccel_0331 [Ruminiclostridium cellulolyticum H10]
MIAGGISFILLNDYIKTIKEVFLWRNYPKEMS